MFKRLLCLILSIPLFLTASVQWQEDGVPVRQAENITSLNTFSLNDGSFINVWGDSRDGEEGIYAQRIDSSGENLWDNQGIEVFKSDHMQYIYSVVRTSDNCIVICWKGLWDNSYLYNDLFRLQKIDENGNLLWGNSGVILDSSDMVDPKLFALESGLVYLFYVSYDSHEVRVLQFQGDGTLTEGWENTAISDNYVGDYELNSDLNGGVLISFAIGTNICIQKLDEAGSKPWGSMGIIVQTGYDIEYLFKIKLTPKTSEEFLVSWVCLDGYRSRSFGMQSVSNLGECNWTEPSILSSNYFDRKFSVSMMADSSSLITWRENTGIFMNKIDPSGNILWGNNGILQVAGSDFTFSGENIFLDNDGNTVFTWTDSGSKIIYIQKIDSEGNLLLPEPNIPLYVAEGYNPEHHLSVTDENYYLSWVCNEEDHQLLKHQILNYNGNIELSDMGESFYSGILGNCRDMALLDNGDNPIILWSDTRNHNIEQIYMQKLDSDGIPQFSKNGIAITTFSGSSQKELNAVIGKNSDVVAVIWANCYADKGISVQGLDVSGNFLWSDDIGLELMSTQLSPYDPKIDCYDNNGTDEFYLGWSSNDYRTRTLFAQKIIDGTPQWDEPIVICDDAQPHLEYIKDRFFIWENGFTDPGYELKVKLIDETGSTAENWPENGLLLDESLPGYQKVNASLLPEGIFINWTHRSNDNVDHIHGQIIDFEGNLLWENNILFESDNFTNICSHFIVGDDIYLAWNQYGEDSELNLYLHKLNLEGDNLWAEDGIQISYDNRAIHSFNMSAVENDVLVVWEHYVDYSDDSMLKAQLISPDGELAYNEEGITVTDGFKEQLDPRVYSSESEAYITWYDRRSHTWPPFHAYDNIYAQKLQLDPSNFPNDVVDASQFTLSNYPNPFNPTTTILYSLIEDSNVELTIFNIKGQKVKTLVDEEKSMGQYSTIWDGNDDNNKPVSSGVYMYKLKIENQEITKRMILLK